MQLHWKVKSKADFWLRISRNKQATSLLADNYFFVRAHHTKSVQELCHFKIFTKFPIKMALWTKFKSNLEWKVNKSVKPLGLEVKNVSVFKIKLLFLKFFSCFSGVCHAHKSKHGDFLGFYTDARWTCGNKQTFPWQISLKKTSYWNGIINNKFSSFDICIDIQPKSDAFVNCGRKILSNVAGIYMRLIVFHGKNEIWKKQEKHY